MRLTRVFVYTPCTSEGVHADNANLNMKLNMSLFFLSFVAAHISATDSINLSIDTA